MKKPLNITDKQAGAQGMEKIHRLAEEFNISAETVSGILRLLPCQSMPHIIDNAAPMKKGKTAYGVGEWATNIVNFQTGCEKNCKYCYAKSMAVRHHRSTPESWTTPRPQTKNIEKGYGKRKGTVMMPTSHDITPRNVDTYLIVIKKLLAAGNKVLIVSKPVLSCIKTLCKELQPYKKQILFRFTIGSADNKVLRYWEPNASRFEERLASLKYAYDQGFATSVSSEPMLDLDIDKVIEATRPYVTDSIWLGRVNSLRQAISQNCPGDVDAKNRANELLRGQTNDFLRELYERFKNDPIIKYKDSMKKAVGLELHTEKGLDI